MDSLSFATFYNLTDIRYLELEVLNLRGGSFRIASPLEVVFRNVGTTIMEALRRAVLPDLTNLTITSVENITDRLVDFLEGSREGRIQTLSLIDIDSIAWFQVLRRVPNVKTLELGLTPTDSEPNPFTELIDAPAVHKGDTILVPRLSELRLAGDVLMGIERVVDFLRVRNIERKVAVTQKIDNVETLVLPTGYFTRIPEPIAWELGKLVVALAGTALNRLVEPRLGRD